MLVPPTYLAAVSHSAKLPTKSKPTPLQLPTSLTAYEYSGAVRRPVPSALVGDTMGEACCWVWLGVDVGASVAVGVSPEASNSKSLSTSWSAVGGSEKACATSAISNAADDGEARACMGW